jgi:colanic acid biosynthesis glycosyl transferase WcaI
VIRCPLYVPAKPSGAKRIVHHTSFAAAALRPMLKQAGRMKPQLVFSVAPSLISAPVALRAARRTKAKSWLHIQDFEVEAAFATGLLAPKGRVGASARRFEQSVLNRFDRTSAISPQMCRKLTEKLGSDRKVVEFRNWSGFADRPPVQHSPYREEWGIETPHVALYSGSIGNKQGIESIVDAARMLAHRGDLTFVICGEGPNRDQLKARAAGLDNIRFHDLQPFERVPELMALASVHLLPQLEDAADLVLPSKLVNMLASGRPVVATASPGTGLHAEIEGCGIATPPGNTEAFAQAIERIVSDPASREAMGLRARKAAEERLSADAILGRVEQQFLDLVETSR